MPGGPGLPDGSFFGALAADDRARLREAGVPRTYRRGYMLMMEGQPSTDVAVLLRGWAKAKLVTTDGVGVGLWVYAAGDLFGAEAALAGQSRRETVLALDKCTALLIPAWRFADLLEKAPGVTRAFSLAMLDRALAADEEVRFRHAGPSLRLARILLDLAERGGTRGLDGVAIPVDLTQEDLASLLGLSRSTISRTLQSLKQQRMILTGYRSITITDTDALREVASDDGQPDLPNGSQHWDS